MPKPGYVKFAAHGANYVYDSHTNAVIKIDPSVAQILDDYFSLSHKGLKAAHPTFSRTLLNSSVRFIENASRNGLFQPLSVVNFLRALNHDAFQTQMNNNSAPALCLNITDQCNQSCGYCPQAHSRLAQPSNALSAMTWEVARDSLDCFLALTSGQPQVKVAFFGGEPLLNWELIRQCLLYLRETYAAREIQLRVVSNLTLLNRNILETFIATNAQLQVSLDGPQHIHDDARSFKDGRGTYQQVCDRLAEIRALDPDYFRNNVSLLCTFNMRNDILDVFRYFSEGIFAELSVVLNYVTGSLFVPSPEQAARHEERIEQLIELYLVALRHRSPFRYDFFWNIMSDPIHFGKRTTGSPPEEKWPNGTCVPGAHRLFVTSRGMFYPCENFCHEGWDVGNHETGFEFPKAQALFQAYANLCQEACQGCWAYRLCTCCYLSTFSGDKPLTCVDAEECDYQRDRILKALRRFVYIWENEPPESHNHPFSLHFQLKSQRSKTG